MTEHEPNELVVKVSGNNLAGQGADMRSRLLTWKWIKPSQTQTSDLPEILVPGVMKETVELTRSGFLVHFEVECFRCSRHQPEAKA
jgi:hypothetical protein